MEKNKRKRKAFFPTRTFTPPELDDALFTEKLKDAYSKQDPEVITRFILSMIVLANLPLNFVEHFVFRTFLALVVPWYEVPSRTTIARRLEQAFELCNSDVVAATGKQEFISVTLNTATVINTSKHYMVLTVHYFDKITQTLQSMAVGYLQMLDSTITAEVTEFLKKSLESFKIPLDKIKSVCTDGGSIAVKSCKNVFGEINHVVCVSKTLDSVVKKSLITISAVKDLISKLKVIVKYFKQSSIAAELKKEQMKKPATQLSKTLMLIECMPSSWKSILKAVQRFVLLLPDVKTVLAAKSDAPKLNDATVTSLTAVESLLHHFGIVSDKFSGSLVAPSSGSTIVNIQFLLHAATDNKATDHMTVQLRENLSKELKAGFEDTLSNTLLAAANLVDPRFKGICLDTEAKEKGLTYIKKLVDERKSEMKNDNDSSAASSSTSTFGPLYDYFESLRKSKALLPEQELEYFLDDSEVTMDFNIDTCSSPLQWWIKHDSKYFPYPHLRSVALEILTVQVSCIPSEKTTSALNRVFSDKNCSLSKDNLNRLFVLNSMPLTFWDVYVGAHLDVMQKRSCSG